MSLISKILSSKHRRIATELIIEGKPNESIQIYDELLKKYPKELDLYQGKYIALIMLSRFEDAIDCINVVLKIKPNYYAYYQKASILSSSNFERYEESLKYYDIAISKNKKAIDAYISKGISLACLKRYKDAVICYDKAINIAPKKAYWAYCNKAIAFLRQGKNYHEALELCDIAIKLKKRNNADIDYAYSVKSRIYGAMNNKIDCKTNLRKAIDINNDWINKLDKFDELRFIACEF